MKFGVFVPPYHNPRQNPSLAIRRDLEFVEALDEFGYDSAWFGEHHSGGWETCPSPEIMMAAAAERTKRIKLCSGVISLPYHHPLMAADRMQYLDQLTRGRVVIGVGPGALPADSEMMGYDYNQLRPRMEQALDAILELLDSDNPVNRQTEWFSLVNAQLQQRSFTQPRVPITVASAISPSGPRLAGKYGLGLLSIGGTSDKAFEILESTWAVLEEQADLHGHQVSRADWSIVGQMYVAETMEQAVEETRYGLKDFYDYRHVATLTNVYDPGEDITHEQLVARINDTGAGLIGTPEMAVSFIERLVAKTGGFGEFLNTAMEWANRESTLRSYELFARDVMPYFDGTDDARVRSLEVTRARKQELFERLMGGVQRAQSAYSDERKNS
ncbi:monooxygenase [Streptomyces sp. MNU77]|uniref:LLM class flavin-dependent oxidoreductase n=1 Tax=Streptomyces sp. MNU77 TaxID=1573406 RepID=UPI0007C6D079|nr:LLM class flavin-dependent oxidoreductase [Streptomyces sp. MNU77]OLO26067.1 monooxygenase [Streptomyces sp. MNU77]